MISTPTVLRARGMARTNRSDGIAIWAPRGRLRAEPGGASGGRVAAEGDRARPAHGDSAVTRSVPIDPGLNSLSVRPRAIVSLTRLAIVIARWLRR